MSTKPPLPVRRHWPSFGRSYKMDLKLPPMRRSLWIFMRAMNTYRLFPAPFSYNARLRFFLQGWTIGRLVCAPLCMLCLDHCSMYVLLMLAKRLIVLIIGNFLRFLLIENALPMLSKCQFTGIRNNVCVSNGMVWLLKHFLYEMI